MKFMQCTIMDNYYFTLLTLSHYLIDMDTKILKGNINESMGVMMQNSIYKFVFFLVVNIFLFLIMPTDVWRCVDLKLK